MRAPLTVRISDGATDRLVTRFAGGVKYRKTAPGGHASASLRLSTPAEAFQDLGPADRLWIYGPWGQTVWEGYTNNPGTRTGRGGEGYDLTAIGGMALAGDRAERVVYVDSETTNWRKGLYTAPTSTFEQIQDDTQKPALRVGFANGQQAIGTDALAEALYFGLVGTGDGGANRQKVGALRFYVYSGRTDSGYRTEIVNDTQVYPMDIMSTVSFDAYRFIGDTLTSDYYTVLRMRRIGAPTTVAKDDVWTVFRPVVLGQRMNRYGTLLSGGAGLGAPSHVTAAVVVEDLLGRMLKGCDPATAVVEPGDGWAINQLAYPEATRASAILDDLLLYEPDMLWEILDTVPGGGHRFAWRRWPTTPRYVIPASMPVERPGSDQDLCNRIAVSWIDSLGTKQTIVRTRSVPELGTRVRDADPITLPAGQGSETNAAIIGDAVLAAKASPPRSARVKVDRPIQDLLTGAMVEPWEIEPGYLARVAATGEDLRLTEMEYDDDAYAASIELGTPVPTIDQRIARLEQVA